MTWGLQRMHVLKPEVQIARIQDTEWIGLKWSEEENTYTVESHAMTRHGVPCDSTLA